MSGESRIALNEEEYAFLFVYESVYRHFILSEQAVKFIYSSRIGLQYTILYAAV